MSARDDVGQPGLRLIRLAGVGKSYREGDRERTVFREVDATIARGELVVVVGRSGSGKSTLLNLIGGIDRPTAGEIVVDGVTLTRASEEALARFRLIPTLTVEENLLLPLELNGRTGAPAWATALHLLEEVGLADRVLVIRDGRLVTADVAAAPRLS